MKYGKFVCGALGALFLTSASADAATMTPPDTCAGLPTTAQLKTALETAVKNPNNKGLGFNMWATIVGNDGKVCAVAFSGSGYGDQWLASRVISAQKASTANSLSLGKVGGASAKGQLALSSANLYSAVRDGGSLLGLQFANPVDPSVAYHVKGEPGTVPNPATFGTVNDPMIGQPIGGTNVFGGGLVLVNRNGVKIGGVGVSGDTSCTDHTVAWLLRRILNADWLKTGGISGPAALFASDLKHPDNIIFDIPDNPSGKVGDGGLSKSGFGHPTCLATPTFDKVTKTPLWLPAVQ